MPELARQSANGTPSLGLLRLRQVHRHLPHLPGRRATTAPAGTSWPPTWGSEQELLDDGSPLQLPDLQPLRQRCPAEVAYTALVQKLRELAYKEGVEPECPHGGALQSVMRMMAKGGTQQDRLGWLDDDLKTDAETGRGLLLDRLHDVLRRLLPRFEVDDPRRHPGGGAAHEPPGRRRRWSRPRSAAAATTCSGTATGRASRRWPASTSSWSQRSGAETLVASCAECLRTWKVDYEPFFEGKPPKIVHITEFLAERLAELTLKGNGGAQGDLPGPLPAGPPPRLYEPPREVLDALPGVELAEMPRSGKRAPVLRRGHLVALRPLRQEIQVDRLREARATGAEVLVTACPKCQIHFRCAMKDPNLGGEIEIEMRDVAELVAEALRLTSDTSAFESREGRTAMSPEPTNGDLRVGVFVCDCGLNIAGAVDCGAVTEYAETLPDVVCAVRNKYTCADPGQNEIKDAIQQAQAEPGGRRLLHAAAARAHLPAVRARGRAQPLPHGDGQPPRALLLGAPRRPRGRHRQGQGPGGQRGGARRGCCEPQEEMERPGHQAGAGHRRRRRRASRPPWSWPTPGTR